MTINGDIIGEFDSLPGSIVTPLDIQEDEVQTVKLESIGIGNDEWISLLEVSEQSAMYGAAAAAGCKNKLKTSPFKMRRRESMPGNNLKSRLFLGQHERFLYTMHFSAIVVAFGFHSELNSFRR